MVIPAIIIAVTVLLDQITKILAKSFLDGNNDLVVIPHILGFTYVENKGAAFGIFADNRWVFMLFSTLAIIAMIYLLFKLKNQNYLFIISLSMLIGGGIGNMIDRIFRGYVVDFFKFLFVKFAIFNVADCFVTVGAFVLFIYLIFIYDDKSDNKISNSIPEHLNTDEKKDKNEDESNHVI